MNDLTRRTVFENGHTRISVSDVTGAIWINQHSITDAFSRSIKVPEEAIEHLRNELTMVMVERSIQPKLEMAITVALEPREAWRAGWKMINSAVAGWMQRLAKRLETGRG